MALAQCGLPPYDHDLLDGAEVGLELMPLYWWTAT